MRGGSGDRSYRVIEGADGAGLGAVGVARERQREQDLAVAELDALLQEERNLDALVLEEAEQGLPQLDPVELGEVLGARHELLRHARDPRVHCRVVHHGRDVPQVLERHLQGQCGPLKRQNPLLKALILSHSGSWSALPDVERNYGRSFNRTRKGAYAFRDRWGEHRREYAGSLKAGHTCRISEGFRLQSVWYLSPMSIRS